MSLKIGSVLRRALVTEPATGHHDVHFHAGPAGRIYPCDVDRCESPHLTMGEVSRLSR